MSVLTKQELVRAMSPALPYGERLIVTPLLSPEQIGPASIDVRLGSSLITFEKAHSARHDVTDAWSARAGERRLFRKARLLYHSQFVLHPGQLILGATFEYLALPANLFCMILSRSSWGRLGLVVATASAVQPGYVGCLTLELVNLSESPIALYPGLLIGQLVFHSVLAKGVQTESYSGRYKGATDAEVPKFYASQHDEFEHRFWGRRTLEPTGLSEKAPPP